jgi:hypothetical protein
MPNFGSVPKMIARHLRRYICGARQIRRGQLRRETHAAADFCGETNAAADFCGETNAAADYCGARQMRRTDTEKEKKNRQQRTTKTFLHIKVAILQNLLLHSSKSIFY